MDVDTFEEYADDFISLIAGRNDVVRRGPGQGPPCSCSGAADGRFLSPFTGGLYADRAAAGPSRRFAKSSSSCPARKRKAAQERLTLAPFTVDYFGKPLYTASVMLPRIMRYAVEILAKRHAENRHRLHPCCCSSTRPKPAAKPPAGGISQFTYILETVKYWKSFGPIDITVTAGGQVPGDAARRRGSATGRQQKNHLSPHHRKSRRKSAHRPLVPAGHRTRGKRTRRL